MTRLHRSERLLVIALHSADNVLGCGGLLASAAASSAAVHVVVVAGDTNEELPAADRRRRLGESLQAMAALGLGSEHIDHWRYQDGIVPLSGRILEDYFNIVRQFRPTKIFLPAPSGRHPDHRAVTRGAINALVDRWTGELLFYETTDLMPLPNVWVDLEDTIEAKRSAMACHRNQLGNFDYQGHIDRLSGIRGSQSGNKNAEAFHSFKWDGSWQHFFYPQPFVSVIVRACDSVLLHEALRSLRSQRYDLFEVILVWFGDGQPELDEFQRLDIRVVGGCTNRATNLNLGIAVSRGEFVGILDEDDVLLPNHFEMLLPELTSDSALDICYAGTRLVSCERYEKTIRSGLVVETMSQEYKKGRLLLRNQLAIHSALVRRNVFNRELFDEDLTAYEDWEFWARLEQRGFRFASLSEVTSEYRLFGLDMSAADPIADLHRRKGYLEWAMPVLSRIFGRLTTGALSDFEERATDAQDEIKELERQVKFIQEQLAFSARQHVVLVEELDRCRLAATTIVGVHPPEQTISLLIGRSLPPLKISVVCPIFDSPAHLFGQTFESVVRQTYPHWELCIVDDGSTDPGTREIIRRVRDEYTNDSRIKFAATDRNRGIVAATTLGVSISTGDFIGFLDHDDLLHPDALLEVALAIRTNNGVRLIYTDSNQIDHVGNFMHRSYKCGWAPESLLCFNYINHLTVIHRDSLLRAKGLAVESEGVQDWDLLLRLSDFLAPNEVVHIRKPLYDWRATKTSLAYRAGAKPRTRETAKRVLELSLRRKLGKKYDVGVESTNNGFAANWDGGHREVLVIIPTHSNLEGLRACVQGLLNNTDYAHLKIKILANRCESVLAGTIRKEFERCPNVTIAQDDRQFNWSALNNAAILNSNAELLLFLNDDVEILKRDWLKRMVRYLALPEVGAVGAFLTYPDGGIQHNGIKTDQTWIADNQMEMDHPLLAAQCRNVSAVTGACMLTSRNAFDSVGGFDEDFPVNYNDVDYCLALRANGYRIVQANDVRLCHHESRTRGYPEPVLWESEKKRLLDKWGDMLAERYTPSVDVRFEETRILHID